MPSYTFMYRNGGRTGEIWADNVNQALKRQLLSEPTRPLGGLYAVAGGGATLFGSWKPLSESSIELIRNWRPFRQFQK